MELACEPNVSDLSSWAVHDQRLMWSELMPKIFNIERNGNLLYYRNLKYMEWVRFKRLEACDSINFVNMKKSLALLTSALKTRTTVRLRLCALKSLKGPGF